ncbi:unnamed protein product [Linum tenue]|uniref:CASP-like protein n=1 Tax=Linum tenue TaxID=586396 RepID=A0AAV0IH09_9ROSI|nr:unnamed protein product [Linum tenue]
MEAGKPSSTAASRGQQQHEMWNRLVAQLTALKILAIAFTASAICVMVTSNQNVLVYGIPFSARFTYSTAFKFLVAANGIVCGFSVVSLFFILPQLGKSSSSAAQSPLNLFYLLLHEMVMMGLMTAACGAATAIGLVGYDGIEEIGWMSFCENVPNFCHKMLASVVLSYMVLCTYLALTFVCASKLAASSSPH